MDKEGLWTRPWMVDQLINHVHVPPRFDFFRVSCSWFHLHHSDIMVKRHSSTSEQIEWASTTVQEWHQSRREFTELNSELVCFEHLTLETLEQKMRFAATESLLAWSKTVSSHQAVDFVQLARGLRQSCGTLVRRSAPEFWMGSSGINLERWNVRSESFPLLPFFAHL